jgi:hypothetical protein
MNANNYLYLVLGGFALGIGTYFILMLYNRKFNHGVKLRILYKLIMEDVKKGDPNFFNDFYPLLEICKNCQLKELGYSKFGKYRTEHNRWLLKKKHFISYSTPELLDKFNSLLMGHMLDGTGDKLISYCHSWEGGKDLMLGIFLWNIPDENFKDFKKTYDNYELKYTKRNLKEKEYWNSRSTIVTNFGYCPNCHTALNSILQSRCSSCTARL